jgi:hypothetical protein
MAASPGLGNVTHGLDGEEHHPPGSLVLAARAVAKGQGLETRLWTKTVIDADKRQYAITETTLSNERHITALQKAAAAKEAGDDDDDGGGGGPVRTMGGLITYTGSLAFESRAHKLTCACCNMQFHASTMEYFVPMHRIVELQQRWEYAGLQGRRYQTASFLYALTRVCTMCSQFFESTEDGGGAALMSPGPTSATTPAHKGGTPGRDTSGPFSPAGTRGATAGGGGGGGLGSGRGTGGAFGRQRRLGRGRGA